MSIKNIEKFEDEIVALFNEEATERSYSRKHVLAGAGDEYYTDDYSSREYGIKKNDAAWNDAFVF